MSIGIKEAELLPTLRNRTVRLKLLFRIKMNVFKNNEAPASQTGGKAPKIQRALVRALNSFFGSKNTTPGERKFGVKVTKEPDSPCF